MIKKVKNKKQKAPKLLFGAMLFVVLFSSCTENDYGYTITGKIEDISKQIKIYLKNDHTGVAVDSTETHDGNFSFKGLTEFPQRYSLTYKSDEGEQSHFLWIENTTIEIIGKLKDIKSVKIKAGREQKLVEEMGIGSSFFYPEYRRLIKENKNDSIRFLIKKLTKAHLDFSVKNANSYMAIEMLYRARNEVSKDSLGKILMNIDSAILNSEYGKSLQLYAKSSNLEVGSPYVDFTTETLEGTKISISELLKKEKPLLIIFGGLGCMQEHGRKILKNFHDTYKEDIEILAFVFARNEKEWIIDANYPLDITLVSDMKGDHSPIKIQYDVQVTPTVFLINKEGIITFKSLGYGNDVNEAAKKLFFKE